MGSSGTKSLLSLGKHGCVYIEVKDAKRVRLKSQRIVKSQSRVIDKELIHNNKFKFKHTSPTSTNRY